MPVKPLQLNIHEAELTRLSVLATRFLTGRPTALSGPQRQRRRAGYGGETEDFRPYVDGDELRRIDWRLSARSASPWVRVSRDEVAGDWTLAIDCSASLGIDAAAWRLARTLSAAFSFLLLASGHRVGLLVYAERVMDYCPPGRGRPQYLRLLRLLEGLRTVAGGTSLRSLLGHLDRNSPLVVVSDFLAADGMVAELESLLRLAGPVHALQVQSTAVVSLPRAGTLQLRDVESAARLPFDTAHAGIQMPAYQRLQGMNRRIEAFCRRRHIHFSRWHGGSAWIPGLVRHLQTLERGLA